VQRYLLREKKDHHSSSDDRIIGLGLGLAYEEHEMDTRGHMQRYTRGIGRYRPADLPIASCAYDMAQPGLC